MEQEWAGYSFDCPLVALTFVNDCRVQIVVGISESAVIFCNKNDLTLESKLEINFATNVLMTTADYVGKYSIEQVK